jgi:CRP-like cAMP-binding protein
MGRRIPFIFALSGGSCPAFKPESYFAFTEHEIYASKGVRACPKLLCGSYAAWSKLVEVNEGRGFPILPAGCAHPGCDALYILYTIKEETIRDDQFILNVAKLSFNDEDLRAIRDSFLANLPPDAVLALLQKASLRKAPKGSTLVEAGAQCGNLFLIAGLGKIGVMGSGLVKSNQPLQWLANLSMGHVFGLASLLSDRAEPFTYQAQEDAYVFEVSRDTVKAVLAEYPEACARALAISQAWLTSRLSLTKPAARTPGLHGQLAAFSPMELLQNIGASKKTGSLRLSSGKHSARWNFMHGDITGAVCDDLVGEAAVYASLKWTEGEFEFEEDRFMTMIGHGMAAPAVKLALEAMRRMDHGQT